MFYEVETESGTTENERMIKTQPSTSFQVKKSGSACGSESLTKVDGSGSVSPRQLPDSTIDSGGV